MRVVALAGCLAATGLTLGAAGIAGTDVEDDCLNSKIPEVRIAGCTALLQDDKLTPRGRAIVLHFRGNGHFEKNDHRRALADYNDVLGTKATDLEPKFIEATIAGINQKVRETPLGAEAWRRVFLWKDLEYKPSNLK